MNKRMKLGINRLLRPFTLWLVESLHKKKYKIIYYRQVDIPKTPTIFAFTHISSNDTMIATEIIRKPAHLLMASDPLTTILKLPLMLLGMVAVDRKDKTKRSQRDAMDEMARLLELGSHIGIFPEAIWNVTANRLVLPLHWGIIELAQRTGRPIIPVSLIQADSGDYYINMGDAVTIDAHKNKAEAIEQLYCILGDLAGQMVFDPQIQKPIPRNEFSPKVEYTKKLQSDFGFEWDAEYESQFLQCNTPHQVARQMLKMPLECEE